MDGNMQNMHKKFTVILLHYNQQKYLHTSLQSIFRQDFPCIELIFADDATANLDTQEIERYVEDHKRSNIVSVSYQIARKNHGTIRTINKALHAATGDYVLFFAADDALRDAHTLSNYAMALDSLPDDAYVAAAQCDMMDENLEVSLGSFVNEALAYSMNQASAQEQYIRFVSGCLYAIGATAFKREVWEKYGYFDETYRVIEDWSFFLRFTRNGGRIHFFDFVGLQHRDGGISHFNSNVLPPHVIAYQNDSLMIMEREILPYLSVLQRMQQIRFLERYEKLRTDFGMLNTDHKRIRRIEIVAQNKALYLRKGAWLLLHNAPLYRRRIARMIFTTVISWSVLSIARLLTVGMQASAWVQSGVIEFLWYGCGILACLACVGYVGFALLSMLGFLREKWRYYFSEEK